jgi:phage protein U
MQLAALGLFVFELATFLPSSIKRDSQWIHAAADRVGARPSSQFVGPGAEALSIAGAIVPEAAGSYGAIDTLRKMADEGEAWAFVDGAGKVWGNYVIAHLGEDRRHMMDDGTPRMIDFTIDLDRRD